jgi:phospholipase C
VSEGLDITRRGFLKTGAALGTSGLVYGTLGGRVLESASARAVRCGGHLSDIEHIVVLMQENRSFDEFFGTFPGVRGFDDKRNRQAFTQPGYHGRGSRNGHLLPFHTDGRKPIGQCLGDLDRPTHDWAPQHLSWNRGRNNRFYSVHAQKKWDGAFGSNVMSYFKQPDIPYFWALARAYTLCDMYFGSVIGPTEPNRLYSVSATLDPAGTHGGPNVETVFDAKGLAGKFSWTTMPEQLQARGISWKSYTAAGGQFDSPFPAFTQFQTNPALNKLGIQPVYPDDFETDLANDTLPSVSWLQVSFGESEHPGFPPAKGEYAVDQVLRAIWAHPQIWRKTAVIINHDENGGFFDHVPPPVAPPGTKGEYLTVKRLPPHALGIRGPIGLGFRVPSIIVSPWTRGGFVCSDTFDHTSVLRLMERRFGAEVPNLSKWRRSVTGDLTTAFNFASKPDYSVPKLPPTSATSPLVTTGECVASKVMPYPVPAHISMPRQQPGRARRPSSACATRRVGG